MDIHNNFRLALEHYQSGNLQIAERLCREILKVQPEIAPILHLLGIISFQLGNYDQSVEHINKSLLLNPDNPDAYNHLGSALKAKGDIDEAITYFQKAINLNPSLADAYYNLGNTFIIKRQAGEAITCYKKAIEINPDFTEAYNNLGNILQEKGELDEAVTYYQKAIQLNPELSDAYYNLGSIFQEKGHFDEALTYYQKAIKINPKSEDFFNTLGVLFQQNDKFNDAIACYQRALQINPHFASAYNNLGNVFQEKRHFDDAIACYQKAIQCNPDFAFAYNNLGNALQGKGHFDEAITCHQKALQINPEFTAALNNLGEAFQNKGLFDEAIACYEKALQLNPNNSESYSNLGSAFQEKGQFDKAIKYHQKALETAPTFTDAHWNMSLTLLSLGNFKDGWKKYEWRFLKKDARPSIFPYPRWDGRPLKGKSIIISAEQGVGDEIMFASCLPELIAQAELCVVECDRRLIPLFARSFPKTIVIERLDSGNAYRPGIPLADMQIPMGSLPKFLRPNLASFPQQGEYLIPDNHKTETWRKRYTELGEGLKIGISWRGGSKPAEKLARSTVLAQWKNLFSVSGVHFINLQYGDCTNELREAREKTGITIHDWEYADPLTDLDDFAAKVSALDLVISVDNATVHMAGALGVPVWVLLPFSCDWRWMRDFEDTPWYKSVRLTRQGTFGNWNEVFERVTSDLGQYISTGVMPGIKCSYKSSIPSGITVHTPFPPVPSEKTYRCAVITPVGPGHENLYQECLASIEKSFAGNKGRFSEIIPIRIDDPYGKLGRSRARNLGIKQAAEQNVDWIFFIDADDLMAPLAFEYVSPYLDEYDGIWGSIWPIEKGETTAKERPQQLPFLYTIEDVLSGDPFVTLGIGHFVNISAALSTPFDESLDAGEDFDYYLRVWEHYRCIKIPLPFWYHRRGLHSHGPRSATGLDWQQKVESIMKQHLENII